MTEDEKAIVRRSIGHILSSIVKIGDAPMSSSTHLHQAIYDLGELAGFPVLQDSMSEWNMALHEAIEEISILRGATLGQDLNRPTLAQDERR